MYLNTRRVKPQKLSHTAKRVIEDRDYWLQAYLDTAAELKRVRRERDQAQAQTQA